MVIDLKIFIRNLNYESRVYYIEIFMKIWFWICKNIILFRENFTKIGYYNYYM